MIFISSLAFVGLLAVLPTINRYLYRGEVNSNNHSPYSFLNIFGKGAMYVFAIFTQHGMLYKRLIFKNKSHLTISFFKVETNNKLELIPKAPFSV